jgi:hypothetical protein
MSGGTDGFVESAGPTFGAKRAAVGAESIFFPLRVPSNAWSLTVEIMHHKVDSGDTRFSIESYKVNWGSPGTITKAVVDSVVTNTSGDSVEPLSLGSVDPDAEYRIRWSAANTMDTVLALRVAPLGDRGPVNTM